MNYQGTLWDIVWGAGPMVKLILLILLGFSVLSWAIIIYKLILLRRMERETASFSAMFWEKRQFAPIAAAARSYSNTPLAAIFSAVYTELAGTVKEETGRVTRDDIERIERLMKKTVSSEASRLEYAVPFLATTGNTAPFIGLFGTVWGIMSSFRSIGAKGAANIAVVAPGISEALVATAVGLAVAIPAVVGYNHILARIDRMDKEMESFSSDLLNIIEKQLAKKSAEKE